MKKTRRPSLRKTAIREIEKATLKIMQRVSELHDFQIESEAQRIIQILRAGKA